MVIVVLGATGNAGTEVVARCAALGHEVRAVSRHPDPGARVPAGARAVAGDLDDAGSLTGVLAGAQSLFTLAGYAGLPGTLAAARDAGVARAVLLSSSAAPTGRRSNAVARYHIESEDHLRASGMDWTILQPNTFMANTLRWLPQLRAGDTVRDAFGDVAVSTVDPADIAEVAALALTGSGHAGQTYRLTGPQALRPADRVAILAEMLGRDLHFVPLTDAQARAEMSASMPAPYVDAFFEFFADGLVDETTVLPTVEQVTGRPPGTFRGWAAAHRDLFG
jgi:uncharacterized protein YbjT (DUF2867 family)